MLEVRDRGTLIPEDQDAIIAQSKLGLERLETAMRDWIDLFPAAAHDVMTYVLAKSMGGPEFDARDEDAVNS